MVKKQLFESMDEMDFGRLMQCPKPELCDYIKNRLRAPEPAPEPDSAHVGVIDYDPQDGALDPVFDSHQIKAAEARNEKPVVREAFKKRGKKKRNG